MSRPNPTYLRPQKEASPEPIAEEVREQLVTRIVTSSGFSKSDRLTSFLLHVCELDRAGRTDEINEQQIGHVVFGRRPDYDPGSDGIVRSHASRLRMRLEQYFAEEGANEPIRLHIPRGTYVPVFEPNVTADSHKDGEPDPQASSAALDAGKGQVPANGQQPSQRVWRGWWLVAALLLVAVLLAANLVLNGRTFAYQVRALVHPSPSQLFWKTMFVPGRPTLLVAGDAGANMFSNMARRDINPEEYSTDSWSKDPAAQTPPGFSWVPIARRSYTPFFIVDFAAAISRLPEVADGQLSVRFARYLRLKDLEESQAILLGGTNYDPWEGLLSGNRNFRFAYDQTENSISILNAQPAAGERSVYKWKQGDPNATTGYLLITLTHNLNGTGRMLLLQGTTAQGDETAAGIVLDPVRFDPILSKAIGKDGKVRDFEALLETKFVAGGSIGTTLVAFRAH